MSKARLERERLFTWVPPPLPAKARRAATVRREPQEANSQATSLQAAASDTHERTAAVEIVAELDAAEIAAAAAAARLAADPIALAAATVAAEAANHNLDHSDSGKLYDLDTYKQHLRAQMAQQGFVTPPPSHWRSLIPEFDTPPRRPASSASASRRYKLRSPRSASPRDWSPTGRLWGPNHPLLSPRPSPRPSPRAAAAAAASSPPVPKPGSTPRKTDGTASRYVDEATLNQLLEWR